jgi:uncharacterized phage protein (TIGR02218 family)
MKSSIADWQTRVLCLRIVTAGGTTIRLTHHPVDIVIGANTYLSTSGYDFSGYAATADAAASVIELSGIAGLAGIGEAEIMSGVFDGARAYLFATSWAAPVEDEEPIVASILGKTVLADSRYTIEEMSLIDALSQSVGDTYTAACGKVFGGQEYAGCMVALGPITVTGTLSHVTSTSSVRDSTRAEAADYFAAGTIAFTSGANAGLKAREIKSHAANGTVEVFEPFHFLPAVGDAYTLIPGCRKRLQDCRDKWTNVANFGGFSWVPASSQYGQVGSR